MLDFTYGMYNEFIESLMERQIDCYTVNDWIKKKPAKGIILRHDVDRFPSHSLKIAQIENKHGISSTFYFRAIGSSFSPHIIKTIKDLGHEIGYHYEDLSNAKGDYAKAITLFKKNLKMFRLITPIYTIAMHGRPLCKYDNRLLWRKYSYRDFGVEEAYLSIDYSKIFYFTDSGRSWNSKANLRDYVKNGKHLALAIKSTKELVDFIKNRKNESFSITHHPERWFDTLPGFCMQVAIDSIVNVLKTIYSVINDSTIHSSIRPKMRGENEKEHTHKSLDAFK